MVLILLCPNKSFGRTLILERAVSKQDTIACFWHSISRRLPLSARIRTSREGPFWRIKSHCLGSPQGIDHGQFMPAPFQLPQHGGADSLLDFQLVGPPLVVEARLGQGSFHRLPEVDGMNYGQQRLANDGRAPGSAQGQNRFSILQYHSRAHAGEWAFASGHGISFSPDQTKEVAYPRLDREIIH